MVEKLRSTKKAKALFGDWEETLILSCMQEIMGEIYVDNQENPLSAMAILGDFVFFAGKVNRELVLFKPDWCKQNFIIMVPQNEEWGKMIEDCYKEKADKVLRYAIKKQPKIFHEEKLQEIIKKLPDGYELKMIDEHLYNQCRENDWSRDFVSQYRDYETYDKLGLGAVILKNGEIVSGASSYTTYKDGIEIEIDTKKQYRRKGLASICGAKLILECQKRNLYPSWDAQNLWSVSLAEKLGYEYSHAYTAYEVVGY